MKCTAAKKPLQARVGDGTAIEGKLEPPQTEARTVSKPRGFYTAEWLLGASWKEWTRFLRSNSSERRMEGAVVTLLTPDPDARTTRIESLADYWNLTVEYPFRHPDPRIESVAPNWPLLATIAEGVMVSRWAIEESDAMTLEMNPRFWGWDVESTLWLKWAFIESEFLGVLETDGLLIDH
jgi:hypothetical protein